MEGWICHVRACVADNVFTMSFLATILSVAPVLTPNQLPAFALAMKPHVDLAVRRMAAMGVPRDSWLQDRIHNVRVNKKLVK